MWSSILPLTLPILIGAAGGGLLGATRRCPDGGCPLTATPWRGAAYGATIGLFITLSGFLSGCTASTDHKTLAPPERSVSMSTVNLSEPVHLSAGSFAAATDQGLALVDFWAPWCGPCRMLGPVIDQLAASTGDSVLVAKVNVDEEPDLAQRFEVSSIPCMVLLKDGQEVDRRVGFQQAQQLQSWIDEHR